MAAPVLSALATGITVVFCVKNDIFRINTYLGPTVSVPVYKNRIFDIKNSNIFI